MNLGTYEIVMYILAGIALLYVIYNSRENMTVADVKSKEDAAKIIFGKIEPQSTKKKSVKPENPIMGPRAPELDPNAVNPSDDGKNKSGVYPDIYGPEMLEPPGKKDVSPLKYDMEPAAEFPAGPSEPEPYLNDFSRILKM
jgi:hypothetical protein